MLNHFKFGRKRSATVSTQCNCNCELRHEFARAATLVLARHNATYHSYDEPEM